MCFDSQVSSLEFLLLSLIPYHPLLTKISFIFSNLYYKACRPASKTGQWVKPLAAKPDELSSIPRTQVEGENQFQEVVPDLHMHAGAYVCAYTQIYERKKKKINQDILNMHLKQTCTLKVPMCPTEAEQVTVCETRAVRTWVASSLSMRSIAMVQCLIYRKQAQ